MLTQWTPTADTGSAAAALAFNPRRRPSFNPADDGLLAQPSAQPNAALSFNPRRPSFQPSEDALQSIASSTATHAQTGLTAEQLHALPAGKSFKPALSGPGSRPGSASNGSPLSHTTSIADVPTPQKPAFRPAVQTISPHSGPATNGHAIGMASPLSAPAGSHGGIPGGLAPPPRIRQPFQPAVSAASLDRDRDREPLSASEHSLSAMSRARAKPSFEPAFGAMGSSSTADSVLDLPMPSKPAFKPGLGAAKLSSG